MRSREVPGPAFEIDHVQVMVPPDAMDEAARFYGRVLGLAEVPTPAALAVNGGRWYRLGGLQLHLSIETEVGTANATSRRHIAYRVDDLEAAMLHFLDHGVEVIEDHQPVDGFRRFYVRDPGGNRIEVLELVGEAVPA